MSKKITIPEFKTLKEEGKHFTMITCYDYCMARIVDESDCQAILVGDSVGNVIYGYANTIPVTLDQMILATKAVSTGAPNTLIVGDLPFGSYQESDEQAVRSAVRLMKEGGCDCVKLEGGKNVASRIEAIVKAGIPVFAHIGLTPQSAAALGGMRVQGKKLDDAIRMYEDVIAVEKAGAFACVVECVPVSLCKKLNEAVKIPLFAGGKGTDCAGSGLNLYDMFGFSERVPKFVKKYGEFRAEMVKGLNQFHAEVNEGIYPAEEHSYYVEIPGLDEAIEEAKAAVASD